MEYEKGIIVPDRCRWRATWKVTGDIVHRLFFFLLAPFGVESPLPGVDVPPHVVWIDLSSE